MHFALRDCDEHHTNSPHSSPALHSSSHTCSNVRTLTNVGTPVKLVELLSFLPPTVFPFAYNTEPHLCGGIMAVPATGLVTRLWWCICHSSFIAQLTPLILIRFLYSLALRTNSTGGRGAINDAVRVVGFERQDRHGRVTCCCLEPARTKRKSACFVHVFF